MYIKSEDKYVVSDELAEFHKCAEGFSNSTYRDSGNVLTIGIGHANQETAAFEEGDTWSDHKCLDVWKADIDVAVRKANEYIGVDDVPDGLFDAYVDLIFNVGFKPNTMTRYIDKGDFDNAARQLTRWIFVNGQVELGLVKRRMAMYAHTQGDDWREIMNYPLSSKNSDSIKGFNELIAKYGFELNSCPNTKARYELKAV